jgi:hypothetical protein
MNVPMPTSPRPHASTRFGTKRNPYEGTRDEEAAAMLPDRHPLDKAVRSASDSV